MLSLTLTTKTLGHLALACVAISLLGGCSFLGKRVNAYERSTLSKPGMALVENGKEQAAMNHMFNAREGSSGGLGGAGGGCGCN
ncbi:MAG: DUF4266 domain-containing protein [Bdellovibrionota bacterium]